MFQKGQAVHIDGYISVVHVLVDRPMFESWVCIFLRICASVYKWAAFMHTMFCILVYVILCM